MDLELLNSEQREAVLCTEGPLLILAGAGSGKTRVLTHRVAYLVEECEVNPWNILAITFTNKAAKEMRERIDDIIGFGSEDIWVSTFHSLCLQIMFRHADKVGYQSSFEICDAADQKSVMKDVLKRLELDPKIYREKSMLAAISSAKDSLIGPEIFAEQAAGDYKKEQIARIYGEYQRTLKRNNSFDFDDLIMQTVELFRQNPDVLAYYQERFRYIMVDEYQDTNTAQFELIHLLSRKYQNLCVVGDDDQSIYKFRGANINNILDFEKFYPQAKIIKLEQNYRSTGNILEAANEVIANNFGRKAKSLWTESEDGEKIHFKQTENASEEAMFVAEDIRRKVREKGIHYGDCAILMRTNVQSKEFEDAFRVLQIDYELVKGLRFWDTKVIKDISAYLLTIVSGLNDMRTARIINVPKRGIGNASIDKVQYYADLRGISLMEACEFAEDVPGLGKAAEKVKKFAYMILRLRGQLEVLSFAKLVDAILDETDYLEYLNQEADTPEKYQEMIEYIEKLKDALTIYEEGCEHPDLVDFMRQNGVEGNNLDKTADGGVTPGEDDEAAAKERKVLIMTMHNAKGLEFPCVYLVGMEDGLFPSYMSINGDDPTEIEEERRLCYVGITRAREDLTITCARARMINGETRYSKTSRFVKEIPFGLLDMDYGSGGSKIAKKPSTETSFFSGSTKKSFTTDYSGGNSGSRYGYVEDDAFDLPKPAAKTRVGMGTMWKPESGPYGSAAPSAASSSGYSSTGSSSSGYRPKAVKKTPKMNPNNPYLDAMKGSQIGTTGALSYGEGDRVRHVKFGEGTVLAVKDGGRDYEVTVDFDTAGVRKMFAGFAKLVKL